MTFKIRIHSSVGVDLSCPPPILAFNKIIQAPVGADLSALGGYSELQMKSIIVPYLQKGDIYLWQASNILNT